MPRYLTISDDLQINVEEGCRYLSRSGDPLEYAQTAVCSWVEAHPTHPRREEAERWLERADDKLIEQRVERAFVKTKDDIRPLVRQALWERKVPFSDIERKTEEITEKIARNRFGLPDS